jgi:hypothetical protein
MAAELAREAAARASGKSRRGGSPLPTKKTANSPAERAQRSCRLKILCFTPSARRCARGVIMAKGQMKAKKEVRKPKKDAKKPAAAKAAPLAAAKPKS